MALSSGSSSIFGAQPNRMTDTASRRSQSSQKLIDRYPCRTNQASQGAFGDLLVIRNGESGVLAFFDHDNVAAALPGDLPAKFLERPEDLASAD